MSARPFTLVTIATVPMTIYHFGPVLDELSRMGWTLHAVAGPGGQWEDLKREHPAVAVHTVPMRKAVSPFADIRVLFRLVQILRRVKPDIVHCHSPKGGLLGGLAARIAGVRCVAYTIHGAPWETARGSTRALLLASEAIAISCADIVLTVSESLRRLLRSTGIVGASRARVLGAGSTAGVPWRPDRRARKHTHHITYGFIGRADREKGLEDLLHVWPEIVAAAASTPNSVRLLVLAPLTDHERSPVPLAILDAMREDESVTFVDRFLRGSEYWTLLEHIDVLVLPSFREGFPSVVLEAAACGIPTVGYCCTGTVNAIIHGETGILTPVGHTPALAAGMLRFLSTPELIDRMGSAAQTRARSDFTWPKLWDEYKHVYHSCLPR